MLQNVKVFIEGIEVPVAQCQVSSTLGTSATAMIVVPARRELFDIFPFCNVDIYALYLGEWYLAFSGYFTKISASYITNSTDYQLTAISKDWFLRRLPFGFASMGTMIYDSAALRFQGISGENKVSGSAGTNAFLSILYRDLLDCSSGVNELSERTVNAFTTFLNTANPVHQHYFMRMNLHKYLWTYVTPLEKFRSRYNVKAVIENLDSLGSSDNLYDSLNILVDWMMYEIMVNLFPSMSDPQASAGSSSPFQYMHIKPSVPYGDIPASNIIPAISSSISYDIDYAVPPTRLAIVNQILSKSDNNTSRILYTAPITALGKSGTSEYTQEELEKYGIHPLITESDNRIPLTTGEGDATYWNIIADNFLWRNKLSHRNTSVTSYLNPQVLVGLPCLYYYLNDIYIGYMYSVSHSFTSATTTYSIAYARSIYEDIESPQTLPWIPDDYVNKTEEYYKAMHTSTGIKTGGGTGPSTNTSGVGQSRQELYDLAVEFHKKHFAHLSSQMDYERALMSQRSGFIKLTNPTDPLKDPYIAFAGQDPKRQQSVINYVKKLYPEVSFAGVSKSW